MELHIQVQNSVGDGAVDETRLQESVRVTLDMAPPATHTETGGEQALGLSIVITEDAHMGRLNAEFGQKDSTTDVLAFPAGTADPDTGTWYLGDIIISLPQAALQAAEGGHGIEEELQLLAVHGTLHLLGYDHHDLGTQEQMWRVQERVLQRLNNPTRPQWSE